MLHLWYIGSETPSLMFHLFGSGTPYLFQNISKSIFISQIYLFLLYFADILFVFILYSIFSGKSVKNWVLPKFLFYINQVSWIIFLYIIKHTLVI